MMVVMMMMMTKSLSESYQRQRVNGVIHLIQPKCIMIHTINQMYTFNTCDTIPMTDLFK